MPRASELAGAVRSSVVLVLAAVAGTSLPYLYAWLSAPDTVVYTGLMYDVVDHAQYWSWVTASRAGLFISNTMTPEPNPAIFMNPTMWVLSQVQGSFGLSFATLFQFWRVGAIVLLIPALVTFMHVMVPRADRRSTAILLAVAGSGLGWMWVVGKKVWGLADVPWPEDLYTVEPNTFWSMLGYPYLSLAHALILATMLGAWLAHRGRGWWAYGLAGVASVALALSHAYDLITVYGVLAVFGLVEWIRFRQLPRRLTVAGLVVGFASGPVALYYQQLTSSDPLWRSILSQYPNAGVWTPTPPHLVVLLGVPVLLAAWGMSSRTGWTEERRFAAVWAVVGIGLAYLPVVFQIKLLSGLQFPVAVLAAHAWHDRVMPIFDRRRLPRAVPVVVLLGLVSMTNVYLFAWRFLDLGRHASPYYLHQDEAAALAWLADHTEPTDVVLALPEVGQFVPNYGRSRAYLAHWAMTNRFFERRENVERFFAPGGVDRWREDLLAAEGVTLVLRTVWNKPPDDLYDPAGSVAFERVFDSEHAQIYRFRGASRDARILNADPR
jgi:hypothetical protein